MNVYIVDNKKNQPMDIIGCGAEGILVPNINKVTGKDDPFVQFPNGRFLYPDTIYRNGGQVWDADTKQAI